MTEFLPDPEQLRVLEHRRGPLLVTGVAGTGKTVVLRERFARLIEEGADPERVALVVRTKRARVAARAFLLKRLRSSLPAIPALTVHGLANHVVARRFGVLGFETPPQLLSSADQFARVRDLLAGEDPADWPVYGSMLRLRGFADEVRQFVRRCQEALVEPADVVRQAERAAVPGWKELAGFYGRYLDILASSGVVDFAGLVAQAAVAASGARLFDHILVDDYQEATFAQERLLVDLGPDSLVLAGDAGSHVFSFQGTTDQPLRGFTQRVAGGLHVKLRTQHRAPGVRTEAWIAPHTSEEHAAVSRELVRTHVQEGVPWAQLAVVVRRQDHRLGGLIRALDDAGVPREMGEGGLSLLAEPATFPFVLALRWLARPEQRDGLVEALLTSGLVGLSPAAARGHVRAATAEDQQPRAALDRTTGLSQDEADSLARLRDALRAAEEVAERSVLDAFRILWRELPYGRDLVEAAWATGAEERTHRDLDAVVAFAQAASESAEGADPSVSAFLAFIEGGAEGPGLVPVPAVPDGEGVRLLTAHASAGLEFDTVIVAGAVEGSFPSLSRPEPMFDLTQLERPASQSERNRARLEDERRLFDVVRTRARRRVLFTAGTPQDGHGDLSARSRFVSALGVSWTPVPSGPDGGPLDLAEAAGAWRRTLAAPTEPPGLRLAALEGLTALRPWVAPARWWFQREWTGTDRPLHETIRVSFSKLDTLENCELQYVLARELGLESRVGYHAWVGHLVHELVEEFDREEIPRTLEDLVETAEARWRREVFPSFAVSEAFRKLVTTNILPGWFREYGKGRPLDRELRFEFDFDGAQVSGVIDRIGRAGSGTQITDYKTGKSRNAAKAEENLQLGIYYLAVNTVPELQAYRPVKAVELAFLRDRDWRSGEIARTVLALTSKEEPEYREAMTTRLHDLIARIRDLLESERYRPNPQANCRFCEFKPLCPLFPEGGELFASAGSVR